MRLLTSSLFLFTLHLDEIMIIKPRPSYFHATSASLLSLRDNSPSHNGDVMAAGIVT